MLALLIKLSAVTVNFGAEGDKYVTTVEMSHDVWINADRITMVERVGPEPGEWYKGLSAYTRVGMASDDSVLVSETPEEIVALINAERDKVTN